MSCQYLKIRGFQTLKIQISSVCGSLRSGNIGPALGDGSLPSVCHSSPGSASMLDSCCVATSWALKSPDQVISKDPGSSIVIADLANTRVLDLRLGAHSSRSRGRNNEVTSHAWLLQSCPWSREAKSLSTTCLATSALESWMQLHGSGQASLQNKLTKTDSGSCLLRGVLSAIFFRLQHRGFSRNGKGFYLTADGLASPGSGWWLSRVCWRTVRLWQDPGAKGHSQFLTSATEMGGERAAYLPSMPLSSVFSFHLRSCLPSAVCLVAQLCPTLWDPVDCSLPGSSVYADSPGKKTGVGCHALLQGIFPPQASNLGLSYCRQILYHLSHQGSPLALWLSQIYV